MREEMTWWVKQAMIDLEAAQDNLRTKNYYLVAFLCHQAAEKALKGLYVFRKQRVPPRTHALRDFARTLSPTSSLQADDRRLGPGLHFDALSGRGAGRARRSLFPRLSRPTSRSHGRTRTMDHTPTTKLAPFIRRVKRKFPGARFILFGSRARGTATPASDYDILIVADGFRSLPFYERHVQIYELQHEPIHIDAICLTPEEYQSRSKVLSVVGVAVRRGVELAAS